jgi:antitoxin (DNA-binding transcriptional repressor) of toxin-antitoxin stability system
MTIWVSIDDAQNRLPELADRAAAGEAVVLSRDGVAIATLSPPLKESGLPRRTPGLFAHLGPLQDPDLFLRPDPELEEDAEARDEDHLYRLTLR